MKRYVLGFQEIDMQPLLVGGKGVNLGELSKIHGIQVPEGFCVTIEAYQKALEQNKAFHALLDQLTLLKIEHQDQINEISWKIRKIIMEAEIPSVVDRKSTRLNSSHVAISYAVFCSKKKTNHVAM